MQLIAHNKNASVTYSSIACCKDGQEHILYHILSPSKFTTTCNCQHINTTNNTPSPQPSNQYGHPPYSKIGLREMDPLPIHIASKKKNFQSKCTMPSSIFGSSIPHKASDTCMDSCLPAINTIACGMHSVDIANTTTVT